MRAAVQRRYRSLLVDEYQDTNSQQLALLRLVQEQSAIGITVVGDDDQSIYSFRGAEPGIFASFRRHMPRCQTVTLSQNYRCTGKLLRAANAVISRNACRVPKHAWTSNAEGGDVVRCECYNAQCEADWLVGKLGELRARRVPFNDVAILYRTHAIGKQLAAALRERGAPIRTAASDLFARADLAPVLALLRLLSHPEDSSSFRAVAAAAQPALPPALLQMLGEDAARRGVSQLASARALHAATSPLPPSRAEAEAARPLVEATAAAMEEGGGRAALHSLLRRIDELLLAARSAPPSQLLAALLQSGLVGGVRPQSHGIRMLSQELTAAADAYQSDEAALGAGAAGLSDRMAALRDFTEHAALCEYEEAPDDGTAAARSADALTLSTLHGAKGLEWEHVFIVRCNDETIPLNASSGGDELSNELLHEEQSLFRAGCRGHFSEPSLALPVGAPPLLRGDDARSHQPLPLAPHVWLRQAACRPVALPAGADAPKLLRPTSGRLSLTCGRLRTGSTERVP